MSIRTGSIIRASVKEVADVLAARQIHRGIFVPQRARLGQEAHVNYLDRFDPDDIEVPVRGSRLTRQGMQLKITGRIDVLKRVTEGYSVTEYKSVILPHGNLQTVQDDLPDRYLIQTKLYAYLIGESLELNQDGDRLVTCKLAVENLTDGELQEFPVTWNRSEVEAILDDYVESWLENERCRETEHARRVSLSDQLSWPYPAYRSGQKDLCDAVSENMSHDVDILISAPPGVGKTMAVLSPALSNSLRQGRQLFFATAKGGGRQPVSTALEAILEQTPSLRAMILPASSELCLKQQEAGIASRCDACEYLPSQEPNIDISQLLEKGLVRPEDIRHEAEKLEYCPYRLSRLFIDVADIVVGDYNFVFDGDAKLSQFRDITHVGWNLLVDEAHNLFDRVRDMNTLSVDLTKVIKCLKVMEFELLYWSDLFSNDDCLAVVRDCWSMMERIAEAVPVGAYEEIDIEPYFDSGVSVTFGMTLARILPAIGLKIAAEVSESWWWVYNVLRQLDELNGRDREQYPVIGGEGNNLTIICLDPSQICADAYSTFGSVAAFSGTLSPLDFFRTSIGFGSRQVSVVDFQEDRDPDRLKVIMAPGIDTRFKLRPRRAQQIAATIDEFVRFRAGGYLAVFPSFDFAELTVECLSHDEIELVQQTRRMSSSDRADLRKTFEQDHGTVLGVVVAGGQFTEAADHPGKSFAGVVIVGPCLPPLTAESELLRAYWDRRGDDGFGVAYAYPAIRRVIQAAGRLIRQEDDRGVILLMDDRFMQQPYFELLPVHWQGDLNENRAAWQEQVKQFWHNDQLRTDGDTDSIPT